MSNVSYTSEARLSDSVEREINRETLANGETLSATSLLKFAGQCISAAFSYIVAIGDILDEARSMKRNSHNYW